MTGKLVVGSSSCYIGMLQWLEHLTTDPNVAALNSPMNIALDKSVC